MRTIEIEQVVNSLLKLKAEGKSKDFIDSLSEFKDFRKNNKTFYDMILAEDFDQEIFKKMISLKRKVEEGGDSYEADVKFGKFMAEKFIDPVIKK